MAEFHRLWKRLLASRSGGVALRRNNSNPGEAFRGIGLEQLEPRLMLSAAPVVGANVDLSVTRSYESEGAIAIDPTNPQRLFATSNRTANGLQAEFSNDGGATWTQRALGVGTDHLPVACCDPSVSWDAFGNLFLSYLNAAGTKDDVLLSIDGGRSFTLLAAIPADDQPTVTTGPSAAPGQGSVWVTFTSGDGVAVAGAAVAGLGQVGNFGATRQVPGSSGAFGDISVGPDGQLAVTWEDPARDVGDGSGPQDLMFSLDADGLGPGGFTTPIDVTGTAVGDHFFLPAQDTRSIDSEVALAWDLSGGANQGRLYMLYTDVTSGFADDTDILLRSSDDGGQNWTAPLRVNDDATHRSQFFGRLAIDQTSGDVAVTFYDARNDSGNGGAGDTDGLPNTDVAVFGAISTDGGQSFGANFQISAGVSNSQAIPNSNDFGDYNGLAFDSGLFFPIWTDNSAELAANPDPPQAHMATARVTDPGAAVNFISGTVFNDTSGDGAPQPGEAVAAGATVFLDLDHGGTLDGGEPSAVTDSSGDYVFRNLAPGSYDVRQIFPAGFGAGADGGLRTVDVLAQTSAINTSFADVVIPTISIKPTTSKPASETRAATAGKRSYTITRTGTFTGAVTVDFTLSGSATNITDYTLSAAAGVALTAPPLGQTAGSVTIPAGKKSVTITLTPVDDAIVEPDEAAVLTLDPSPGDYSLIADAALRAATIAILDDEPTLTVSLTSASAASETKPTTSGKRSFTIRRTGSTAHDVLIAFTLGGSALNITDYALSTTTPADLAAPGLGQTDGTITLRAGQKLVRLFVTPVDDALVEGTEQLSLALGASPAYRLAVDPLLQAATMSIADNDIA